MGTWHYDISGDGGPRLRLEGDYTVADAPELKRALQEALAPGVDFDVDISGVTRVDVTFFQVLHAAAATSSQHLGVAGSVPAAVVDEAEAAGLESFILTGAQTRDEQGADNG